jgi:hypothetical protein
MKKIKKDMWENMMGDGSVGGGVPVNGKACPVLPSGKRCPVDRIAVTYGMPVWFEELMGERKNDDAIRILLQVDTMLNMAIDILVENDVVPMVDKASEIVKKQIEVLRSIESAKHPKISKGG